MTPTEYAKRGWHLFPSKWKNGTHKPLIKWKEGSSKDPKVIEQWIKKWPDAYFCVNLTASDLTVLDVDNKKGKTGDKSLMAMEMDRGTLPSCPKVKTPSGGWHYYMKGATRQTVEHLGHGLDTPTMVPIPGTVIPGRGRYEPMTDGELPPCPQWLKDMVGEPKDRQNTDVPIIDPDQPHNIIEAIKHLSSIEGGVKGSGCDQYTFSVAAAVKNIGISEGLCLELMADFWNERCDPPWPIRKLQTKIQNAYLYSSSPEGIDGRDSPVADFTPVDQPGNTPKRFKADLFGTGTEYLEPIKYLVDRHLELGSLNVIFGDPGSCKSFYAIGIAACVASGTEWYGNEVSPGPVLYIAGEGQRGLKRRFAAYAKHHSIDLSTSPLYISRGPAQMMDKKAYKELKEYVSQINPCLIILDTVARNFGGGDENSTADMNLFVARVDRLGGPDCVRLCVHHTGQANKERGRGSSVLRAAADAEWRMEETKTGYIKVSQVKSKDTERHSAHNYEKVPVVLATRGDGVVIDSIVLEDQGAEMSAGDIAKQPPEFIEEVVLTKLLAGEKQRDITKSLEISSRKISELTAKLVAKRKIIRRGSGKDTRWEKPLGSDNE